MDFWAEVSGIERTRKTFAYNFVDLDEATPREEFHGTVVAEDSVEAALIVMGEMFLDGSRVQVYNVIEMQD